MAEESVNLKTEQQNQFNTRENKMIERKLKPKLPCDSEFPFLLVHIQVMERPCQMHPHSMSIMALTQEPGHGINLKICQKMSG